MKRLTKLIILAVLLSPLAIKGQSLTDFFSKADTFFATYVAHGKVDYKALSTNSDSLDELLKLAGNIRVNQANANAFQAFWINAYNLAVIQGIVANYPINSPLDKAGFFDSVTYNLAGKSITLNDIENKMLREKFNDPRVHFVLVCGANGCPPIIESAYLPDTLEDQLQKQTVHAINNPNFIKVKGRKVGVSEIFKWYNQDFVSSQTTLIDFLNRYRETPLQSDSKVSYYAYDWKLNAQ